MIEIGGFPARGGKAKHRHKSKEEQKNDGSAYI